ncbi:hypothetical protein [Eisenibacter elegans]|jgi:hypothetical protein|uniref:hypothetical protein n=1 Tax=Eisenibacter elegans TaxID=997 RepID=UPI00040722C7|nr:hypothetical protein [Eisenibacter elegans]
MNNTKNVLDTLFQAQTKAVENFFDTTKKASTTFKEEGLTFEKSSAILKEWFQKQQEIMETAVTSVREQVNFESYTPEAFKSVLETQRENVERLFSSVKGFAPNYSAEQAINEYQTQTDKVYAAWKDMHERLVGQLGKPFSDLTNPAEVAQEMNHRLIETVRGYIAKEKEEAPKSTAKAKTSDAATPAASTAEPAAPKKAPVRRTKKTSPAQDAE